MKLIAQIFAIAAAFVVIVNFLNQSHVASSLSSSSTPTKTDESKRKPILPRLPSPLRPPQSFDKDAVLFQSNLSSNKVEGEFPSFQDRTAPNGEEPMVDYPEEEWIKNIGSKLDGAGMCVFSAFEMMMIYHGQEQFRGFRNWCAQNYRGGGYPDKLDSLVEAYCKKKGIDKPKIIQYVGDKDDFIRTALENGWMPCVTLAHSPRYGPAPISHMVNAVHLTEHNGAIMDNNFKDYEWVEGHDAFMSRLKYRDPNNGRPVYWGVAICVPGPPPGPRRVR